VTNTRCKNLRLTLFSKSNFYNNYETHICRPTTIIDLVTEDKRRKCGAPNDRK